MRVAELWRFPVKSLGGERLDAADIESEGISGDRRYALFDMQTGFGLTARRVPELLFASARLVDHSVEITLPDGSVARDNATLSAWLGRRVELRDASFAGTRTFEVPLDIDTEAEESWVTWNGPRGPFHDSPRHRVSLLSRATIGDWDARRFRANVVLDGEGEDDFVGSQITIGSARLDVLKQIDRCVMVTRPQPGGIQRDLDVLKTINDERAGNLAVGAVVLEPGALAVGDEVVSAG
jgi:uncharacterized protein YcbX